MYYTRLRWPVNWRKRMPEPQWNALIFCLAFTFLFLAYIWLPGSLRRGPLSRDGHMHCTLDHSAFFLEPKPVCLPYQKPQPVFLDIRHAVWSHVITLHPCTCRETHNGICVLRSRAHGPCLCNCYTRRLPLGSDYAGFLGPETLGSG